MLRLQIIEEHVNSIYSVHWYHLKPSLHCDFVDASFKKSRFLLENKPYNFFVKFASSREQKEIRLSFSRDDSISSGSRHLSRGASRRECEVRTHIVVHRYKTN